MYALKMKVKQTSLNFMNVIVLEINSLLNPEKALIFGWLLLTSLHFGSPIIGNVNEVITKILYTNPVY